MYNCVDKVSIRTFNPAWFVLMKILTKQIRTNSYTN